MSTGSVYLRDKTALVKRLHRIEGQVRGIERMVEEERYCVDLLTQISAAAAALETVGLEILRGHVANCVAEALASGDSEAAELKGRELLAALERFMRGR